MRPWVETGAAIGATTLAVGLYARAEWPWIALGWVALVPWMAVLDRAPSLAAVLRRAVVMAVAFEAVAFGWFARAVAEYAGVSHPLALVVLLASAPILQPQLLTFAAARRLGRHRGLGPVRRALAAAGVYVGTEWLAGKLFADTLGYGLYGATWLRQAADLAGAHGLTLVLVVANEAVLHGARALARPGPRTLRLRGMLRAGAVVAALAGALALYGAGRCRQYGCGVASVVGEDASITAAVVQADIGHYDRLAAEIGTYRAVRRILDAHLALSRQALARAPVALLVWPETVYPTTLGAPKSADGAAFDREITGFVAATGVPLVLGTFDVEAGQEFNAAAFVEPAVAHGAPVRFYRKTWLFPLTERVPRWLDLSWVRRQLPWLGRWQPGPGPRVVPVTLAGGRTVRIAPLICYDALAPAHVLAAVRRGADVIVNLSNDSWLLGTGARLHLLGAAFLSIETRRPQLRATPTGVSAIIDATGAVVARAGVHERAALVARITPAPAVSTLRLQWGDWLGPAASIVATLLLVGPRRPPSPWMS